MVKQTPTGEELKEFINWVIDSSTPEELRAFLAAHADDLWQFLGETYQKEVEDTKKQMRLKGFE